MLELVPFLHYIEELTLDKIPFLEETAVPLVSVSLKCSITQKFNISLLEFINALKDFQLAFT